MDVIDTYQVFKSKHEKYMTSKINVILFAI